MRNLTLNLKQNLLEFWHSTKFFRLWVYALSVAAVLAFTSFIVLSLLAKDRIENAQVLFEKDISSVAKSQDETSENFVFLAKLHHFTSPIFRHQRNISHIKIKKISWENEIDKSTIATKPANNGKDANKFLQIHTSQDLNAFKSATLGVAEYETSFAPLVKTLILYYFGLILLVFVLTILWRHFRFYTFLLLAFLAFCDFVVSITDDKLTLVPFGLIGLVGFGLCVFLAFRVKNSKAKLFFAYFSVVPLFFGIIEFYFYHKSTLQMTRPHEILGYANTPLYKGQAKFVVDDKVVYNDTAYTHDGYGNRVVPNNNENSKKCLAIYGGSFAYGSAVNDNETLEFYLTKNLPEFKLLNFGIGATGAHTALARVQFDIDKNILDKCNEFIAIYEAIPHHIHRASGAWMGPRYELDSNNTPIYWGVYKEGEYAQQRFWQKTPPKIFSFPTYEQKQKGILRQIHAFVKGIFSFSNALDKSYIYKALNKKTSFTSKEVMSWGCIFESGLVSNCDTVKLGLNEINLYFNIVKELDKTLKEKFGTPLHIVLWDYNIHDQFLDKYDKTLKENFAKMGVKFWSLSEMIEDYTQDFERVKRGDYDNFKYRVSRWDTHPNALANEKIAEFLAKKIKNGEIKSYPVKQNHTQKDKNDTK